MRSLASNVTNKCSTKAAGAADSKVRHAFLQKDLFKDFACDLRELCVYLKKSQIRTIFLMRCVTDVWVV